MVKLSVPLLQEDPVSRTWRRSFSSSDGREVLEKWEAKATKEAGGDPWEKLSSSSPEVGRSQFFSPAVHCDWEQ